MFAAFNGTMAGSDFSFIIGLWNSSFPLRPLHDRGARPPRSLLRPWFSDPAEPPSPTRLAGCCPLGRPRHSGFKASRGSIAWPAAPQRFAWRLTTHGSRRKWWLASLGTCTRQHSTSLPGAHCGREPGYPPHRTGRALFAPPLTTRRWFGHGWRMLAQWAAARVSMSPVKSFWERRRRARSRLHWCMNPCRD